MSNKKETITILRNLAKAIKGNIFDNWLCDYMNDANINDTIIYEEKLDNTIKNAIYDFLSCRAQEFEENEDFFLY